MTGYCRRNFDSKLGIVATEVRCRCQPAPPAATASAPARVRASSAHEPWPLPLQLQRESASEFLPVLSHPPSPHHEHHHHGNHRVGHAASLVAHAFALRKQATWPLHHARMCLLSRLPPISGFVHRRVDRQMVVRVSPPGLPCRHLASSGDVDIYICKQACARRLPAAGMHLSRPIRPRPILQAAP